jgi:hypothetical protein
MHRRNISAPTPIYIDPSWNRPVRAGPAEHHRPADKLIEQSNIPRPTTRPVEAPPSTEIVQIESAPSVPPKIDAGQTSAPRRTPASLTSRSLPLVPPYRPPTPTYAQRSLISDAPPPYGVSHPASGNPSLASPALATTRRPRGPRTRTPQLTPARTSDRFVAHQSPAKVDELAHTLPLDSPDMSSAFAPSPIALRGLTLDAARWTLAPAAMQAIVSRAIRQSADTSALRLIPPEVLAGDLPETVLRLDARQRVLRAEHATLTVQRDALFASLLAKPDAGADALSERLGQLQAVTGKVDCVAAELYRSRDQVAQLRQLADMHAKSALSLALRMLNASAQQSSTEAATLRCKVAAREAGAQEGFGDKVVQGVVRWVSISCCTCCEHH